MLRYAISLLFFLVIAAGAAGGTSQTEARPLFDGKSLKGWDGNPKHWWVEDGCIVGKTTSSAPIEENTFLIWEHGEVDDFELTLDYLIKDGNSGVQVRSFLLPETHRWRVGGYQADIDSKNKFTGILYGEHFRGILAMRGQKSRIGENGKPTVQKTFGDHKELGNALEKETWNTMRIVARGYTIQTFINGQLYSEIEDHDHDIRRRSGILALQLHKGPPMETRFKNILLRRLPLEDRKKIVFIAGPASHGWGVHEHKAGCQLLSRALKEKTSDTVLATVYSGGWPRDPTALDNTDAVVMFCDGGGLHLANWHLRQLDQVANSGIGIGCIHYAVDAPKGETGAHFLKWIGGHCEEGWSVNPQWTATFDTLPNHPVSRGVAPFSVHDEWYYHMRFREEMKGVTPILSALPPKKSLERSDGPYSGNPHVRNAIASGEKQHVMWVAERPGANRGFGFTGGHFHKNWANDHFRKTVLNATVWIAGGEIPPDGIESTTPSQTELEQNQDYPKPSDDDQ